MTQYIGVGRIGAAQNVAYTGTAGTVTNGVTNGVQKVRVLVTTDAFVTMDGSTPSATSGAYVVGLAPEYFTVTSGQKVSAVQVSSSGTLYVTEIS
jgi:hypothetical protein